MKDEKLSRVDFNALRDKNENHIIVTFEPPLTILVNRFRRFPPTQEIEHCASVTFHLDFECDSMYTDQNKNVIMATFESIKILEYNQEVPINYFDEDGRLKHKWETIDNQHLSLIDIVVLPDEVTKIVNMAISMNNK